MENTTSSMEILNNRSILNFSCVFLENLKNGQHPTQISGDFPLRWFSFKNSGKNRKYRQKLGLVEIREDV